MAARWLAFVIWAALSASTVFWAFRLFAPTTAAPAHTLTVATAAASHGDLARVFGADSAPVAVTGEAVPVEDQRFQLIGVAAPRARGSSEGVALIVVDGKPARAYRVGAAIDGDSILQSVSARSASIGPKGGPASVALELPALPPPATGAPPGMLPGALPARLPGGGVTRPVTVVAPTAPPVQPMPQPADRPGMGAPTR